MGLSTHPVARVEIISGRAAAPKSRPNMGSPILAWVGVLLPCIRSIEADSVRVRVIRPLKIKQRTLLAGARSLECRRPGRSWPGGYSRSHATRGDPLVHRSRASADDKGGDGSGVTDARKGRVAVRCVFLSDGRIPGNPGARKATREGSLSRVLRFPSLRFSRRGRADCNSPGDRG